MAAFLARLRRGGTLPCIAVACGGRRSVLALATAVRVLRLTPEILLLDHGFLRESAPGNVHRAARALGLTVHHHREPELVELFAAAASWQERVPLCTLCSRWSRLRATEYARRRGARLVVWGGDARTPIWGAGRPGDSDPVEEPCVLLWRRQAEAFERARPDLARRFLRPSRLDRMRDAWVQAPLHLGLGSPCRPEANDDEDRLLGDLGWEDIEPSFPRGEGSDCDLNLLSVARDTAAWGFTHYHLELAHRVRSGALGKEEAHARVDVDLDASPYAGDIARARERLRLGG
jgi:hypothetical protein